MKIKTKSFIYSLLVFSFLVWVPGKFSGGSNTLANVAYAQESEQADNSPAEPTKAQLMKEPGVEYNVRFNLHTYSEVNYENVSVTFDNGLVLPIGEDGLTPEFTYNGVYSDVIFTITLPNSYWGITETVPMTYYVANFDQTARQVHDLAYNDDKSVVTARMYGHPVYPIEDQVIRVFIFPDDGRTADNVWSYFCNNINLEWRLPAGSEDIFEPYYSSTQPPCLNPSIFRSIGANDFTPRTWSELKYQMVMELPSSELRIQHYNQEPSAKADLVMASVVGTEYEVGSENAEYTLAIWSNSSLVGANHAPTRLFFNMPESVEFKKVVFTDENDNVLNNTCLQGQKMNTWFCNLGILEPVYGDQINVHIHFTPLVESEYVRFDVAVHTNGTYDPQFANNYYALQTKFVSGPVVYNSFLPLIQVDGN